MNRTTEQSQGRSRGRFQRESYGNVPELTVPVETPEEKAEREAKQALWEFRKRMRVSVVFEDDSVIAFEKPSGLLTAPDRWDKDRENLMDIVHKRWSPEYFNAHRLDRGTSGIVLCAKNRDALRKLSASFEARMVAKEYMAFVLDSPPGENGVIPLALSEDPHKPGKMRTDPAGQPAETRYEVVKRWRGYSLVTAWPKTGRTHQIRVHLAAVGAPIIGDPMYGDGRPLLLSNLKRGYAPPREGEHPLIGRLALHARRLELEHPVTGQPLVIESPTPKDFTVAIKYLDRFAG
jgi:RluA family pseudouridine synthase